MCAKHLLMLEILPAQSNFIFKQHMHSVIPNIRVNSNLSAPLPEQGKMIN